jgi:hypothetical protein
MSKLDFFRTILSEEFITNKSYLAEPKENMRVDLIKAGCNSFIFNFDKQLGKEYKGGVFPFFNCGEKGVCKVCDYVIFAEKAGKLYSLVIELKKGREGTNPQLKAGVCFVDYIKATVNRVYDKDFDLTVRKVSIKEFKRKNRTKIKDIEYNEHNIHEFSEDKFRLQAFLK